MEAPSARVIAGASATRIYALPTISSWEFPVYAKTDIELDSGTERMRLPVAAK